MSLSPVSTERIFSLSCFEGLRLIKKYASKQPELNINQLVKLIEKVESDGSSLDLKASASLAAIVVDDIPDDNELYYQVCIKAILSNHQPIWSKAMRSGRKRFIKSLQTDDQDVFRAAGLMMDPPSVRVVAWWDDVSGHARLILDRKKMEQGRKAELLSLKYEKDRLNKLDISKQPEWPGLDDNYAGYDILSYDNGEFGLINKMIEVKSTSTSPLRFYVTRNEWKKAEKSPLSYFFHVWDMTKKEPFLYVKTANEIASHIPSDNKKGIWKIAEIPLTQ